MQSLHFNKSHKVQILHLDKIAEVQILHFCHKILAFFDPSRKSHLHFNIFRKNR